MPVLLGLGVQELSVVPGLIPRIKAQIRALTHADCRALADRRSRLAPRRKCARCCATPSAGRIRRHRRCCHEARLRGSAATRPRAHAADRRAADRGPAAAARPAGPARHARCSQRRARRSSRTSAAVRDRRRGRSRAREPRRSGARERRRLPGRDQGRGGPDRGAAGGRRGVRRPGTRSRRRRVQVARAGEAERAGRDHLRA